MLLQDGDLRPAIYRVYSWNITTKSWNPVPSSMYYYDTIGTRRDAIVDGARSRYHPGSFKLTAITQRRYSGHCSEVSCILKRYTTKPKTANAYKVEGAVAAVLSQRSSTLVNASSLGFDEVVLQNTAAKLLEPELNVGTILGELEETVQMFSKPLSKLAKLSKGLIPPRTLGLTAGRAIQYTSDAWLTLRYGIQPLCLDIADGIKYYQKRRETFDSSAIYRVGSGKGLPTIETCTKGISSIMTNVYADWALRLVADSSTISHLYYNKVDEGADEARRLGVSIYQIPNLIYELTRLSFVVDWFVNIGPWIASAVPKPMYRKLGQTLSHKRKTVGSCTVFQLSIYTAMTLPSSAMSHCTWVNEGYVRGTNPSLPWYPTPTGDVLGIVRSLDAAALSYQTVRKNFSKLLFK